MPKKERKPSTVQYTITEMRNGGVRAECYIQGCEIWRDFDDTDLALRWLRTHMASHRTRVTRRAAMSS